MFSQSDRLTALYYRAAQKNIDKLHLDNQMQQLLCYAKTQGLANYLLYVDNGFSGLTFDRPALSALKSDIAAGRIKEIVIKDLSRIGRSYLETMRFIDWLKSSNVTVVSICDDIEHDTGIHDAIIAFLKGGAAK